MKDITLQQACGIVAKAQRIVYEAESKLIRLQGGIACGEPGMPGYDSVRQCFDDLVRLNQRYDEALVSIERLSKDDPSQLGEKMRSLFEAMEAKSKGEIAIVATTEPTVIREDITALALASGFELKDLGEGIMGLRPYVYDFAGRVVENSWQPRPIEFTYENNRITHSKEAPFDGNDVLLCYAGSWVTGNWVEPVGSGEDAQGFCWYIDSIDDEVEFDAPTAWLPNPKVILRTEDVEEPSPAVQKAWQRFNQAINKE